MEQSKRHNVNFNGRNRVVHIIVPCLSVFDLILSPKQLQHDLMAGYNGVLKSVYR